MMTRDEEVLFLSYRNQAESLGIAAGSLRSRNATLQSQVDHLGVTDARLRSELSQTRDELERLRRVNESVLRGGMQAESDVALARIAELRTKAEGAELRVLALHDANQNLAAQLSAERVTVNELRGSLARYAEREHEAQIGAEAKAAARTKKRKTAKRKGGR